MAEQFEYLNVKTGEKFLSDLSPEAINRIANEQDIDLERWLKHITLDEKVKKVLIVAKDVVVKVGDVVIKLGKFLVNLLFKLAESFRNTVKVAVMGAAIGALLGMCISTIPLIGWGLGPFIMPMLVTWGITVGGVLGLAADFTELVTNAEEREILRKSVVSAVAGLALKF